MVTKDLQSRFISALNQRIPQKVHLADEVSDILRIERESALRRLNGRVNFSISEMGLLASVLNISLDSLLRSDTECQWLPLLLQSPLKHRSMEYLYNMIETNISNLKKICQSPVEVGGVYNSLPLEFFAHYPLLMKFMFFKWGHYFVGTEEFNDFSRWEIPQNIAATVEKGQDVALNLGSPFSIWDSALIWTLSREISNFFRMHVITMQEKETIKQELKLLLIELEQSLNGTYSSNIPMIPETSFYVSTMNVGFTSSYAISEIGCFILFQTNFTFSVLEGCYKSFNQLKEWINSLKNISILLSNSGRIERRLFFEAQHKIIDLML